MDKPFVPKIADSAEAEKYTKEVLGIPRVDFSGLSLCVVQEMLRSVDYFSRNYPEVMNRINFIGEAHKRIGLIASSLRMHYKGLGFSYDDAQLAITKVLKGIEVKKDSIASYLGTGSHRIINKYSGIAGNKDFCGNHTDLLELIKRQTVINQFPKGAGTIKAVFDHEFGHALDEMLNLSGRRSIIEYRKGVNSIANSLSENATKNIYEFVADSVMEVMNSPKPRKVSKEVWEIINGIYNENK